MKPSIQLRCFFKRNKIKRIKDIFSTLNELGFDVRGCEYKEDDICGIIVVDEYRDVVPHFDKNKVITYNCKMTIKEKKLCVAYQLAQYIQEKEEHNFVRFADKIKRWETNGKTMLLAKEILENFGKKI